MGTYVCDRFHLAVTIGPVSEAQKCLLSHVFKQAAFSFSMQALHIMDISVF